MSSARFPRLFESLRTHTGLVVREFAARAGMKLQRTADISCGRAVPTDDEIVRLIDASLLTADEISELARGIDPTNETFVELALRSRSARIAREASPRGPSPSIAVDYLSITADALHVRKLNAVATELGLVRLRKRKGTFIDRFHRRMARLYRSVFRRGAVDFCFGPTQDKNKNKRPRRYARVGLSAFDAASVRTARLLLAQLDFARHRVTRVDIAIDVSAPYGLLQIVPARHSVAETTTFTGSRGFESVYHHSARTDCAVKVYDWRAVHGDAGSAGKTRVEAQLRPRFLQISELGRLADPFSDLCLVRLPHGHQGLPYADAYLLRDCLFFGADLVLAGESERRANRVRRLLRGHRVQQQPSAVFHARWKATVVALIRRLGIA